MARPRKDASSNPTPAAPPAAELSHVDAKERLREDILTCQLQPGQWLKIEELRARYDVSVGTLREALTQLASEGLVLAEANRGFAVAPVSVADLLDITELRIDLECKALAASIQEGDDEWEARILSAFHLLQKLDAELQGDHDGEPKLWAERHRRFHEALVSACPSQWVLRFRQTLFDQARRYRGLSMKHSATPGRMDQHRRLMEAALARDQATVCALAETHIRDTAKTILDSLPGYAILPAPPVATGRRRTPIG
jgi:GntR family carbon starvation induced transcriptional regulator